jgi:glycosyltransferase involved in cell wall biosynthesis
MTDRVSIQVIIPYFKEYDYFVEALSSVLSQDYSAFSVLIIDDGTKDQRLSRHISALNDSRIILKQNIENFGLPRNFELARNLSNSDYLVFLGQDDILESDYISTTLPWVIDQKSVVIVQPTVTVIDEFGNKSLPLSDFVKMILFKFAWILGQKKNLSGKSGSLLTGRLAAFILLIGDFLYFPTITWKSSLMNEFDVSRDVTLDYIMIIEVLANGGELLLLSNRLARYRRHKRSASMRPDRMIERLREEKSLHSALRNHAFIRSSFLLRAANAIRFTQRLHSFQIAMFSLLKCDLKSFLAALRCVW